MANFADVKFSVWEAPASLEQCIEVILRIELTQIYCENLESVPAVFAKLNFICHLAAAVKQLAYIACLSIYYRDMTCFDALHLFLRLRLAQKTGPNLRTSLFVDGCLEITKLCTEESISVLKQNKMTLWDLGEELSGNGISSIGKCTSTTLQHRMVSSTCKDSMLSRGCLAYWSRWLEVTQ